ncbi:preprotein translocase subunit SecD [Halovenus rubra]|uniref:Protein-export membrane protein SecD n=2 Tax=Halovenus rubra TaxID=869890 RepID=A0ABD5X1X6_9EURY|nr:preprotein translocase subunit SecD [Halovenus rubra]
MIDVRDNWRVLLLLGLCVLAALALFGPLGADAGETGLNESEQSFDDPTNLQYGLDLSGGTRIRGKLIGMTTEGVSISAEDQGSVERSIADELGLEGIDVTVRQRGQNSADVEVFNKSVTKSDFVDALSTVGVDITVDDIRDGVTGESRSAAVDTLSERIDKTGLGGSSVTTIGSATGGNFIDVEVPGEDRESVKELIGDAGRVQIIAGYPVESSNGTELRTEQVLTGEDFSSIAPAEPANEQNPAANVPVTLESQAGERYATVMQEGGFTSNGIGRCSFDAATHSGPQEGEWCLYTVVDGEYVYGASMSPDLAESINSGSFLTTPSFILQTGNFEEAQQLEINLRSGALPTELSIESASFISPSQAQQFKPLALLTAITAWITVAFVVYIWYRDVRVAVPMFLTATSEVFLLLGFAASFGMALDLSHIAGLIAVIGTGLDDLIIMADEILQRKERVETGRVFQSRFRKAFWIIAMAAGTTIIAMSPLAVLSLGDLQGFAIITIIGVLIGVGITRPAYGDVLRKLMLDDVKRS